MHQRLLRLLSIAVTGAACSAAVSNLAEGLLAPPVLSRLEPEPTSPPLSTTGAHLLPFQMLAARLGLSPSPPPPPPAHALDARLLGTLVSSSQAWSMASVEADARTSTLRVGDTWGPYAVAAIERRRVWVSLNGILSAIDSCPPPGAPPLRAIGPPSREISREALMKALADPVRLSQGVLFVPTASGFRLARLSADSVLGSIGLVQGDEIRSINGHALSSLDALMNAYAELARTSRVELQLSRAGSDVRLQYELF